MPLRNPLKLMKEPVTTMEDVKQKRKDIKLWMIISGVLCLLGIGIFGLIYFGFLLFVFKKVEKKFELLTCDSCKKPIEFETVEEFKKFVKYRYYHPKASFKKVESYSNNSSTLYTVMASAEASTLAYVTLKCPHCGEIKKLKYFIKPFQCSIKQENVHVVNLEIVKSKLERLVKEVIDVYNNPETKNKIPYTIQSVHHPEFKRDVQAVSVISKTPIFNKVQITYHREVVEMIEGCFIYNELNGELDLDNSNTTTEEKFESTEKLNIPAETYEKEEVLEKNETPVMMSSQQEHKTIEVSEEKAKEISYDEQMKRVQLLKGIKELYDLGVMSEEEYNTKKDELLSGIMKKKTLETSEQQTVTIFPETIVEQEQQVYQIAEQSTSSNPTVCNYLNIAKMFLQDGDFENALQYCEKALDLDPENSDAYLYKLLYDLKLHNEKELETYKKDLSKNINFKKAFEFGDEERKSDLEEYLNNKKIIKGKGFDIVYGCIILMNVLFSLSSLVFISLSRKNPLDVYFTMPLQYLSILVLNIFAVVVEICLIVKLFNGSLTYKLNKLSFKIFLISFSVSTFVLVDTILSFTLCSSWVMDWLTFSFSIAVIILSFICIVYATLKNKNESCEDKRRFKLTSYLVAFIICISSIGTHIYWLNCEKVFINKLTNELTEVNCFGKNMEEFVIPEGVTSIDDHAFRNCSRLKSIEIPNSVTSIENSAFFYCDSLTSIVIPNSVTSIGDYAFSYCDSLKSIVIPNSVTSIGNFAFKGCDSLTSIVIPNSVTSIGYSTFSECPIEKATLPISIGTKYYFEDTLKEVTIIGDAIPDEAFCNYENLTSVTISSSVMTIGYRAFTGCSSLTSVIFTEDSKLTSIGNSAFSYCDSLTSIKIPNSVTSIGEYAFSYCDSLTSIKIPNSVTSIGEYAFSYCDNLTSIEIPNSVTSIGNSAFSYCDSLTSIEIPNSVTSIGESAFSSCESLTSIVIPNSVTNIGNYAFFYCYSLTIYCESTSKPSGWDSNWNSYNRPVYFGVNENNFVEIDNLQYILDLENNTAIVSRYTGIEETVEILSTITHNDIEYNVTSIGNSAFFYCDSLISIEIPNSVTSIGDAAFYFCDSLTIYCESTSKPSGWHEGWNPDNRPIYWAGQWENDGNGKPIPLI